MSLTGSLSISRPVRFLTTRAVNIIIIMTLFKCQMYLARTALIGDTFQIELEFRNTNYKLMYYACNTKGDRFEFFTFTTNMIAHQENNEQIQVPL